jgi:hypothetical protein
MAETSNLRLAKEWFRRDVSLADLRRTVPAMLDIAPAHERNIIVRPHGPGVSFIQLDDLEAAQGGWWDQTRNPLSRQPFPLSALQYS